MKMNESDFHYHLELFLLMVNYEHDDEFVFFVEKEEELI
jgi:hypothetical protein